MVGEASHDRRIDACRRGGGRWACGDPRRIWRREAVLRPGKHSGGVRSDEGAPAAHPGRGHAYPFAGEVAVMTAPSCRRALLQADEGGPKADSRWVRGPVEASGPNTAGPETPMMDGADRGPESPRRPGVTPAGGRRRSIAPPRQPSRTSGPAARHGHRPLPVRGDPPTPPPAPGPQPVVPDPPRRTGTTPSGRAATPR